MSVIESPVGARRFSEATHTPTAPTNGPQYMPTAPPAVGRSHGTASVSASYWLRHISRTCPLECLDAQYGLGQSAHGVEQVQVIRFVRHRIGNDQLVLGIGDNLDIEARHLLPPLAQQTGILVDRRVLALASVLEVSSCIGLLLQSVRAAS